VSVPLAGNGYIMPGYLGLPAGTHTFRVRIYTLNYSLNLAAHTFIRYTPSDFAYIEFTIT